MPVQDKQSPTRGSAAWIARYANGLLNESPGMHPLDAVRLAMQDAAGPGALTAQRGLSKPGVRDPRR
jgi:hypothetical protein